MYECKREGENQRRGVMVLFTFPPP